MRQLGGLRRLEAHARFGEISAAIMKVLVEEERVERRRQVVMMRDVAARAAFAVPRRPPVVPPPGPPQYRVSCPLVVPVGVDAGSMLSVWCRSPDEDFGVQFHGDELVDTALQEEIIGDALDDVGEIGFGVRPVTSLAVWMMREEDRTTHVPTGTRSPGTSSFGVRGLAGRWRARRHCGHFEAAIEWEPGPAAIQPLRQYRTRVASSFFLLIRLRLVSRKTLRSASKGYAGVPGDRMADVQRSLQPSISR